MYLHISLGYVIVGVVQERITLRIRTMKISLTHNLRMGKTIVVLPVGTVTINDGIVWLMDGFISFAEYGQNIPTLTIDLYDFPAGMD